MNLGGRHGVRCWITGRAAIAVYRAALMREQPTGWLWFGARVFAIKLRHGLR